MSINFDDLWERLTGSAESFEKWASREIDKPMREPKPEMVSALCYGPLGPEAAYSVKRGTKAIRVPGGDSGRGVFYQYLMDSQGKAIFVR